MGKGGQQVTQTIQVSACNGEWTSPYKPLEKDAPEMPTKGQLEAVIPKECFERSYFWSMFYLSRDVAMAVGFAYATSQVLSTDLPTLSGNEKAILDVALWVFGWSFYAFWMGTIMTGLWVLAHECGHGAFSPSQDFNDVVGFVLHQLLLVPYFAWQFSHAKHHRRTNHLTDGETHVPACPPSSRLQLVSASQEFIGDIPFACLQIWVRLVLGWPLYLLGLVSAPKLAYDGTLLDGRIPDHFRPTSPMFPEKLYSKVFLGTVTQIMALGILCHLQLVYGFRPVFLWYWGPYMVVNCWLVLYTWLQHTDPSVPHFGEDEWTWMKGALSTVDRDYGMFCFFHHKIGSTHVVHHLFHEMPWYNAAEATEAVKKFLEPKGLYNFDPTPWWMAMWKVAQTCHYVEKREGVQYYKSVIAFTKLRKAKTA